MVRLPDCPKIQEVRCENLSEAKPSIESLSLSARRAVRAGHLMVGIRHHVRREISIIRNALRGGLRNVIGREIVPHSSPAVKISEAAYFMLLYGHPLGCTISAATAIGMRSN